MQRRRLVNCFFLFCFFFLSLCTGLFRLSVSGATLAETAAALGACAPGRYALPPCDALCAGALLKQWLRDLPEPLVAPYTAALPPWPPEAAADPDKGRDWDARLLDGPEHYRRLLAEVRICHLLFSSLLSLLLC
jgi:hypothetical protein